MTAREFLDKIPPIFAAVSAEFFPPFAAGVEISWPFRSSVRLIIR
jgi:hypothetical protein